MVYMISKLLLSGILLTVSGFSNEAPALPETLPRYINQPYFEIAGLCWTAKQEGNDYAATGSAITVPGTADPNTGLTPNSIASSGYIYSPDVKVKPGLKIAAGLNLAHGEWKLLSEYTWFFGKSQGYVATKNLNTSIVPLFSYTPNNSILSSTTYAASSGATGFVSSAKSDWTLHFNNINVELKKEIRLLPTLTLSPHFGLQGTWQKQKLKAFYNVSSFTNFANLLGSNQVLFDQTSWGVGLRAGLDSFWRCCNHVGLFADTAISGLWGQFKARAKSYDTNFSVPYENVLIANQLDNLYTVSPVIEVMIGFQFDWEFRQKYLFLAQFGWEEQIWFFQNQHSSTIANTSLILQGLTAKLALDF